MILHPRVLLVTLRDGLTKTLLPSLRSAGVELVVARDFASAKEVLASCPDLLVTDLKLGAFNGLHLAIRARAQGTPVIIIGEPDPVLEAEAERQHARYVNTLVDPDKVMDVVRELLSTPMRQRRSPRKPVPPFDAFVDEAPARLLDVSYEGLRLEATQDESALLPPQFTVRLPMFNFSCKVHRVWTAPVDSQDEVRSRRISCGAALSIEDAGTALTWRALVDSMPGLAFSA